MPKQIKVDSVQMVEEEEKKQEDSQARANKREVSNTIHTPQSEANPKSKKNKCKTPPSTPPLSRHAVMMRCYRWP